MHSIVNVEVEVSVSLELALLRNSSFKFETCQAAFLFKRGSTGSRCVSNFPSHSYFIFVAEQSRRWKLDLWLVRQLS